MCLPGKMAPMVRSGDFRKQALNGSRNGVPAAIARPPGQYGRAARIGFGVLASSAVLGFVMLTRWLVGRGGRHARGAEQAFPARVVATHGAVGLTTFALVLIAATLATRGR
jgi:hypothetical protein